MLIPKYKPDPSLSPTTNKWLRDLGDRLARLHSIPVNTWTVAVTNKDTALAETTSVVIPYTGRITGLSVWSSETRLAGSMTVIAYKNGVALTYLTIDIDATDTVYNYITPMSNSYDGTYVFDEGDRLSVALSATAFDPVPTNAVITLFMV